MHKLAKAMKDDVLIIIHKIRENGFKNKFAYLDKICMQVLASILKILAQAISDSILVILKGRKKVGRNKFGNLDKICMQVSASILKILAQAMKDYVLVIIK